MTHLPLTPNRGDGRVTWHRGAASVPRLEARTRPIEFAGSDRLPSTGEILSKSGQQSSKLHPPNRDRDIVGKLDDYGSIDLAISRVLRSSQ
jgi:hypothetical protein